MWTAAQIEAEDMSALADLTDAQRSALERTVLARNMAHFTAATFAQRLQQQYAIEADLRNAREAQDSASAHAQDVAERRAGLRLVGDQ